jgi:hypothetical protein
MLIVYFKIGVLSEASIRKSALANIDRSVYYPLLGIFCAIVYGVAIFLIRRVDIDERYERAFTSVDKTGALIFILIETILVCLLYYFYMLTSNYWVSWIIFDCFLLFNFIALALVTKMAYDR